MRATKQNAHEFIARQQTFKTGGALSGYNVSNNIYVIYSYKEPIAAWISGKGWLVTTTKFSLTTSHHTKKARQGAEKYTELDSDALKMAIYEAKRHVMQ